MTLKFDQGQSNSGHVRELQHLEVCYVVKNLLVTENSIFPFLWTKHLTEVSRTKVMSGDFQILEVCHISKNFLQNFGENSNFHFSDITINMTLTLFPVYFMISSLFLSSLSFVCPSFFLPPIQTPPPGLHALLSLNSSSTMFYHVYLFLPFQHAAARSRLLSQQP